MFLDIIVALSKDRPAVPYHTNHITEVFIPLFVYFILKDMHVMGQHLKMRVKRSDKVVCAENWDGQKV